MSYTILLSGLSGTASTSFWYSFGFHKQIRRSKTKELFFVIKDKLDKVSDKTSLEKDYIDIFYDTYYGNADVLLEGTADAILENNYVIFLKEHPDISRVCCVFRLREDNYKRILSHLSSIIRPVCSGFPANTPDKRIPFFLDKNFNINYVKLAKYVLSLIDEFSAIEFAEEILGKNNFLIITIPKLFEKQKLILDFLEIQNFTVPSVKLHSKDGFYASNIHFQIMENIKKWYNNNQRFFSKKIEDSTSKIYQKFSVIE